jgi:hypothetical protein
MIQHVVVEGSDIQRVIHDRLSPAIEGENMELSILSMITFAVWIMRPNIEVEELQRIVQSTAEYITLQVSPMGEAN